MTKPLALYAAPSTPSRAESGGARRVSSRQEPQISARAGPRAARVPLTEAIRCMARLLRQENEALLARDFAAAGALMAEKISAAEILAAAWREAPNLDEPAEDLSRLGALAEENKRLMNHAMRMHRRVLDLVTRAALHPERREAQQVRRRKTDSGA